MADGCSGASAGVMERAQNDYGGHLPNRLTIKIAAVGSVVRLEKGTRCRCFK
jgi:hypothetical protein